MVKLKAPLLSLGARNTISKAITFVKRRGQNIAEKKPELLDVQSPAQLSWRHMYQKCAALWHTLSAAEQQEWEYLARPKHMTGFAYWQSQCLRPNPGIYLPLQGGTMSGDIDMAKYRVLKLPIAVDDQEPITLAYTKAYIFPYLYYQGARAYHNANQNIPDVTWTTLALNSERYDTDNIHDNAVNNSRLTCKTAGKYIITGCVRFAINAVGYRTFRIMLNGATVIVNVAHAPPVGSSLVLSLATIYHLAINDFVEMLIYQNSGGVLICNSTPNYSPEFSMQRIGA